MTSPLHSLRTRLALLFFGVTLIAIAAIYLYVVPGLESSLRDEKLRTLSDAANAYSGPIAKTVGANVDVGVTVNKTVRQAAETAGAYVTLLQVSRGTEGVQTRVFTKSSRAAGFSRLRYSVARDAATLGQARDRDREHAGRADRRGGQAALLQGQGRPGGRLLVAARRCRGQHGGYPPPHHRRRVASR